LPQGGREPVYVRHNLACTGNFGLHTQRHEARCISTTRSAVLRGSIEVKGCTRPRRRNAMSMACRAISILCTGVGLLTWDRSKEMADHHRFTLATDIKVYFG
jgi:IS30 family transposase